MYKVIAGFLLVTLLFSCSMKKEVLYKPVEKFELSKYLGTWYEIARFPHSFEKDLERVTATYSLNDNGTIKVLNKGYKNGILKQAIGKAKPANNKNDGHLKVSFFWIFYADYKIIKLDTVNYQYAIVTSGSNYLWFLSRNKTITEEQKQEWTSFAKEKGFDISKLIWVKQD